MQMSRRGIQLLCSILLLVSGAAAAASELWGVAGERWDFAGRLPDFSFAGYKQATVDEPPTPPITRNVTSFRKPGMSDTDMLKAALKWAHAQPTKDWIVLGIPKGQYTLTESLFIKRSKLVLRGEGRGATVLSVPKSLKGVYGPNPGERVTGAYVNTGGFITIVGDLRKGPKLARVTQTANKGVKKVEVDNPDAIKVGQYYDMLWTDVGGRFNKLQFYNLSPAPTKYSGKTYFRFRVKILAKAGKILTLERRLPYKIQYGINTVRFYRMAGAIKDSGVEGLTFKFKWELYPGHHLEKGWNAIFMFGTTDCWVRDIGTVNADSTVLIEHSASLTVSDVRIEVSKQRANSIPNRYNERADKDGHWGVVFSYSYDVLVKGVDVRCTLMHDVGTGPSAKLNVFMDSRMKDGNLDLHRGLAGPTLYTNIDVGMGTKGLSSGGPSASGPNAAGGTTWWNIQSDIPMDPPKAKASETSCEFGPAIYLVGVRIRIDLVKRMCRTWHYERSVNSPSNLYTAQLARRRARQAGKAATLQAATA